MDIRTVIFATIAVIVGLTLLGMAVLTLIKCIQISRVPENSNIPSGNSGDAFIYTLYVQNAGADSYKKMFNCFAGAALELYLKSDIEITEENKIALNTPPEDKEFYADVYNELSIIRGIEETTENDDDVAIGKSIVSMLDKARKKYKSRLKIRGFKYNLPLSMQKDDKAAEYAGLRNYIDAHAEELTNIYLPAAVSFDLASYDSISGFNGCLGHIEDCMEKELKRRAEEEVAKATRGKHRSNKPAKKYSLF